MATTVFTITVLIVCAVALVFAIPVVRQQTQRRHEAIRAEVWAADLVDEPAQKQQVAQQKKANKMVYRWGRISIFGVALVCFLLMLVTGIMVLFSAAAWYVPLLFLGVTVAGLAVLRYLAVQDAKKRAKRRPVQPVKAEVSQVILKPHTVSEKKTELQASESGAPQVKPIKHRQQKPINYASKSLRYARTHHQEQALEPVEFRKLPSGKIEMEGSGLEKPETWDLRETPRPTYLDAVANFRDDVPQLQLSQPDSAESATLKDAAVKAYGMDLDDVLSRRRAQ